MTIDDKFASMRLVLVEWVDAFGCSSDWEELRGMKAIAMTCQSVGWLAHDGKNCKLLVPHISNKSPDVEHRQGCGDISIPTKAIIKITDIGPKTGKK